MRFYQLLQLFLSLLTPAASFLTLKSFTGFRGGLRHLPDFEQPQRQRHPPKCLVALRDTNQHHEQSDQSEDETPGLLLGEDVNQQMSKLRSKYPTSEADYLAAARARAAAKVPSRETTANDEDWKRIALEKRQQMGELLDDWENSKAEAGNHDSQILLPDVCDGEKDDDPKLLLF